MPGLWQFHAMRTAMVLGLLTLVALVKPLRLRLRPGRWRGVVARSQCHPCAVPWSSTLARLAFSAGGAWSRRGCSRRRSFVLLIS